SFASDSDCHDDVDLGDAVLSCPMSPDVARDKVKGVPGSPPTHKYSVEWRCDGPSASLPECELGPCDFEAGEKWYSLRESPIDADPPIWTPIGMVCLSDPDEINEGISAESVAREFRRLTWPQAELVIQSPG